jgi:hypothetical protein
MEMRIPQKLVPLVKAFSVDEQSVRPLIHEAARALAVADPKCSLFSAFDKRPISDDDVAGVISLMRDLAPQDAIETIYAAQIVSSHLLGLRFLSNDSNADRNLGMRLLRFSNEALGQLQKKRAGGVTHQHIYITNNNQGQAMMQTAVITNGVPCQ